MDICCCWNDNNSNTSCSQYVSSAACSQGISAADDYLSTAVDTPIYAVWISLVDSFTDDAISQAPNDNCRNTQTISSRSGANQVNYTATVYVGDVVVQTAVATNKPYGACFPGELCCLPVVKYMIILLFICTLSFVIRDRYGDVVAVIGGVDSYFRRADRRPCAVSRSPWPHFIF